MISLAPIKDKNEIKAVFEKYNFKYTEFSGCVNAVSNNELLGFCLYYLDNKQMTVLYLQPQNDLSLADGILRSTLHVAAERSIINIYYMQQNGDLFEKMGFIKDKQQKTLNIDLLFAGCNCCE